MQHPLSIQSNLVNRQSFLSSERNRRSKPRRHSSANIPKRTRVDQGDDEYFSPRRHQAIAESHLSKPREYNRVDSQASLRQRSSVSHEKGENLTVMRQSNVVLSPRAYKFDMLEKNVPVHHRSTKMQQVTFGPTESDSFYELFLGRSSFSSKKSAPRERSRYSSYRKDSYSMPQQSISNEIPSHSADKTVPRYDMREKTQYRQTKYSSHPIRNDAVLTRRDILANKPTTRNKNDIYSDFRRPYYRLHEFTAAHNDSDVSNSEVDTEFSDYCDDSNCSGSDVTKRSWFQRNMQDRSAPREDKLSADMGTKFNSHHHPARERYSNDEDIASEYRYFSDQDKSADMSTLFNSHHHTAKERYSDVESTTSESLHLSQLEDNDPESRYINNPVMHTWEGKYKRNRSNERWIHNANERAKQVHFRDPISVTTSISSITLEDLGMSDAMNCDCNVESTAKDDDMSQDSVELHSASHDLHYTGFESSQKDFDINTSSSENSTNIKHSQSLTSTMRDDITHQQLDKGSILDDSPSLCLESPDLQTIEVVSKFITEKNSPDSKDEKITSPGRCSDQRSSEVGNFEDEMSTGVRNRFIRSRYFKQWKNNVRLLVKVKRRDEEKIIRADSFYKMVSASKHFSAWRGFLLEQEIRAGEFRCRCLLRKGLSALCWAITSRRIKSKQEERTRNNIKLVSSFVIWKKRFRMRRISKLEKIFSYWRTRSRESAALSEITKSRRQITLKQMFLVWQEGFLQMAETKMLTQHYTTQLARKVWHNWRIYTADRLVKDSRNELANVKRENGLLSSSFALWKSKARQNLHVRRYERRKVLSLSLKRWRYFTRLESLRNQKKLSDARNLRRKHVLSRYLKIWIVEMKLVVWKRGRSRDVIRHCVLVWKSQTSRRRLICSEIRAHHNRIVTKQIWNALYDYARQRKAFRTRLVKNRRCSLLRQCVVAWRHFAKRKNDLRALYQGLLLYKIESEKKTCFLKWKHEFQLSRAKRSLSVTRAKAAIEKWLCSLRLRQQEQLCGEIIADKRLSQIRCCLSTWKSKFDAKQAQKAKVESLRNILLLKKSRRIVQFWHLQSKESVHLRGFVSELDKRRMTRYLKRWMSLPKRRSLKDSMLLRIRQKNLKFCLLKWKHRFSLIIKSKNTDLKYRELLKRRVLNGWLKSQRRSNASMQFSNQRKRENILNCFIAWKSKIEFHKMRESSEISNDEIKNENAQKMLARWRKEASERRKTENDILMKHLQRRKWSTKRREFENWRNAFRKLETADNFAFKNTRKRLKGVIQGWRFIAGDSFRIKTQLENGFEIACRDITMKQYTNSSHELSKSLDTTDEDRSERRLPRKSIDDKMRDITSLIPASLQCASIIYGANNITNCGDSGILSKDLTTSESYESLSIASKSDNSKTSQICSDRRMSAGDLSLSPSSDVQQTIDANLIDDRTDSCLWAQDQMVQQSNLQSSLFQSCVVNLPVSPVSLGSASVNLKDELFFTTSAGYEPEEAICTKYKRSSLRPYFSTWKNNALKLAIGKDHCSKVTMKRCMSALRDNARGQRIRERKQSLALLYYRRKLAAPLFRCWKKRFQDRLIVSEIVKYWQGKAEASSNRKSGKRFQRVFECFYHWKMETEKMRMARKYSRKYLISRYFRAWFSWSFRKNRQYEKIADDCDKKLKARVFSAMQRRVMLSKAVETTKKCSRHKMASDSLHRWKAYTQKKAFHRSKLEDISAQNRFHIAAFCFNHWKTEKLKIDVASKLFEKQMSSRVLNSWRKWTECRLHKKNCEMEIRQLIDQNSRESVLARWFDETLLRSKLNSMMQKRLCALVMRCWTHWKVSYRRCINSYRVSLQRRYFLKWKMALQRIKKMNENARKIFLHWHEITKRSKLLQKLANGFQQKSSILTMDFSFNIWFIAFKQSRTSMKHHKNELVSRHFKTWKANVRRKKTLRGITEGHLRRRSKEFQALCWKIWQHRCRVRLLDNDGIAMLNQATDFRSLRYHWSLWRQQKVEKDSAKLHKRKTMTRVLSRWHLYATRIRATRSTLQGSNQSKSEITKAKAWRTWLKSYRNETVARAFRQKSLLQKSLMGLVLRRRTKMSLRICAAQTVAVVEIATLRSCVLKWKSVYRRSRMLKISCDEIVKMKESSQLRERWKIWLTRKERKDIRALRLDNLTAEAITKWKTFTKNRVQYRQAKEDRLLIAKETRRRSLCKKHFSRWKLQYKVKIQERVFKRNLFTRYWSAWTKKTAMSLQASRINELRLLYCAWRNWRLAFCEHTAVNDSTRQLERELKQKVWHAWRLLTITKNQHIANNEPSRIAADKKSSVAKRSRIPVSVKRRFLPKTVRCNLPSSENAP